ncbi:MAG: hypothetical protein ACSHYF_09980 [Verrucomicrobiaceae bacterium]
MFLHRLKLEFRENRIHLILWILTLAGLTCAALSFWNGDLKINPATGRFSNGFSGLLGLLIVPLILLPFVTTITTFRQDNLKDPRAFWSTRPVRPATLHTAKFAFLHLIFTLPLALCTFAICLNALSTGTALIFTAEAVLWCAASIHLSALASLHNHRWSHLLLIPGLGILGLATAAIIYSKITFYQPSGNHQGQFAGNLLFTLTVLLILFTIAGFSLIKKPHLKFPLWAPVLVGSLSFPLLSASWLPPLSDATQTVTYQNPETITRFTTATSRHNQQHLYLLNFPLDNLLHDSDRHPIELLSHKFTIESDTLSLPGARIRIREWNSGIENVSDGQNLESLAQNRSTDRPYNITITIEIPHERSIDFTPIYDDLPRVNTIVKGELELITVSLDDAFIIDPDQKFETQTLGTKFTYLPSTRKDRPHSMLTRRFALPLASSSVMHPLRRSQEPLVILRHRETGQWFRATDGSSMSQSGMFGRTTIDELQYLEDTTMVSHYWKHRLQREFPDFPDFGEWQKNAETLILPPHLFQTFKVPFEVTLAVPDLTLFQQRLNEPSN